MREIRFIHAADLHLGSKFTNTKNLPEDILNNLITSGYRAFHQLVSNAIEEQVDFVVLSGDIYDSEIRSLKSQVTFRKEMERLEAANISVFIIHGNHDFVGDEKQSVKLPDNVFIFPAEVTNHLMDVSGTTVNLTGFSYNKRHLDDKMIDFYQKDESADYNIGMLHGNLGGKAEHGNYAPFTLGDLERKGFDYWALGHIHKREVVSEVPLAIYPGSIVGRNRKEVGEKGYYFVTIGESTHAEFIPCTDIVWESKVVKFTGDVEVDTVVVRINDEIEKQKESKCGVLLSLTLDFSQSTNFNIRAINVDEIISDIQDESESFGTNFVWVIRLDVISPTDLGEGIRFFTELENISQEMTREEILTVLSDLVMNVKAKKFLDRMSDEELTDLLKEAMFEIKKRW